jgi:hypothetical protein
MIDNLKNVVNGRIKFLSETLNQIFIHKNCKQDLGKWQEILIQFMFLKQKIDPINQTNEYRINSPFLEKNYNFILNFLIDCKQSDERFVKELTIDAQKFPEMENQIGHMMESAELNGKAIEEFKEWYKNQNNN